MLPATTSEPPEVPRTLKKAVTTLAIAPQTESLTRTARLAYNIMIYLAQKYPADEEGGHTAPISEIVKGYGSTTRDSGRVRAYIEQMCTTLVRWFPLSRSDEQAQAALVGMEDPPAALTPEEVRVFTLLSEARFTRRSGEQWVTWYFPPSIREMVVHPTRWAQIDIQEMALLSRYAAVALYEICSRYVTVPGGLTNRDTPEFWVEALRGEATGRDRHRKIRDWRKFKNETLNQALAEINQRTSLEVELIEGKRGRSTVSVQFKVRRKTPMVELAPIDLSLVELALSEGVKERDLDRLILDYSEEKVRTALDAMSSRRRSQPRSPIENPLRYLSKALQNASAEQLPLPYPEQRVEGSYKEPPAGTAGPDPEIARRQAWVSRREEEAAEYLDQLGPAELERFVELARSALASKGLMSPPMQRRFDQKQYRSPMIWGRIRAAYAEDRYGADWRTPPPDWSAPT